MHGGWLTAILNLLGMGGGVPGGSVVADTCPLLVPLYNRTPLDAPLFTRANIVAAMTNRTPVAASLFTRANLSAPLYNREPIEAPLIGCRNEVN